MTQFTVTDAATDLTLLDVEELRVAAGLDSDDTSNDEVLAAYGAEVAAEIASDCAIASDGVNPPTLRSESCSDVFRLKCHTDALFLSRRHVSEITSIEEDGVALADADWRLEAETGKLIRLVDDADSCWTASKIEVEYTAGFSTVPSELKAEAKTRIQIKMSEGSRDPLARSVRLEVPGVDTIENSYQIGGLSRLTGEGLSAESERRLKRFMTQSMVG